MKALITGITGQDGRYLSELLSQKGYQVFGVVRDKNSLKDNLLHDYGLQIHDHLMNLES